MKLTSLYILFTADDQPQPRCRPRKAHRSLLPLELQLDAFVSGITRMKPRSWNVSNAGCEWGGVQCDASQVARKIDWRGLYLKGTLNWIHLPSTVIWFLLDPALGVKNECTGVVNFGALPHGFQRFHLGENDFSGTISTEDLPRTLQRLCINNNDFEGAINWSTLPHNLQYVDISNNRLKGHVNCAELHFGLRRLNVSNNAFDGMLVLEDLPATLLVFKARNNAFTGTPRFDSLPPEIKCIQLNRNLFSGHVDVSRLPRGMSELCLSENRIESFTPQKLPKCVLLCNTPAWKKHCDITPLIYTPL